MIERFKQVFGWLRRHWTLWLIAVAMLALLVFTYYPRNVDTLIFGGREDCTFTLWDHYEGEEIVLTDQQQAQIRDLLRGHTARYKLFRLDSVNGGSMNYLIFLDGSGDVLHLWSQDYLSVNGVQYKLYDSIDGEAFREIFDNDEE